jgi:serine/threonine protein kinase
MRTDVTHKSINQLIDFNVPVNFHKILSSGISSNHVGENKIYIVTEQQKGVPLFEWICQNAKDNTLTENSAAFIIREVCLALHSVQDKGIVHRDLRQENILIQTKEIGTNEIIDDEYSPFNIQICNLG